MYACVYISTYTNKHAYMYINMFVHVDPYLVVYPHALRERKESYFLVVFKTLSLQFTCFNPSVLSQ